MFFQNLDTIYTKRSTFTFNPLSVGNDQFWTLVVKNVTQKSMGPSALLGNFKIIKFSC